MRTLPRRYDHKDPCGHRRNRKSLREYVAYHNELRPHQGIGQGIPAQAANIGPLSGAVISTKVLGGLHRAYRRAA
ncbi:MAG: hypothetical protein K0V04_45580 [Deltaproteobacteria bacterium]|nr:hypothetical protein [Deltaproteobacteria bacterium]